MPFHHPSRIALVLAVLTGVLCHYALGQGAPGNPAPGTAPVNAAPVNDAKGLPPRATPADYQAHAQAGTVTIGAEFAAHSVPTPDSIFTTDDYVVVEVGLFGPPAAHLKLTYEDFSLRINGKKTPLPAQPYALTFRSLKDPGYIPPETVESPKSKGSIGTGGGGGQSDAGNLPPIIHIPIGVERAMEQRVQKASLPEGDRALPEAGLLFFEHRGKTASAELIYAGPAGRAIITLQP
jgi:hypothetical protein